MRAVLAWQQKRAKVRARALAAAAAERCCCHMPWQYCRAQHCQRGLLEPLPAVSLHACSTQGKAQISPSCAASSGTHRSAACCSPSPAPAPAAGLQGQRNAKCVSLQRACKYCGKKGQPMCQATAVHDLLLLHQPPACRRERAGVQGEQGASTAVCRSVVLLHMSLLCSCAYLPPPAWQELGPRVRRAAGPHTYPTHNKPK